VISLSYWSIKLWFHTEKKFTAVLIIPFSLGFPTDPARHQDFAEASERNRHMEESTSGGASRGFPQSERTVFIF
jgi:hypothetical protein